MSLALRSVISSVVTACSSRREATACFHRIKELLRRKRRKEDDSSNLVGPAELMAAYYPLCVI
jgi:hypothetical protein